MQPNMKMKGEHVVTADKQTKDKASMPIEEGEWMQKCIECMQFLVKKMGNTA